MLIDVLRNIVAEKKSQGVTAAVIRNFLKEALQYPALDLLYNSSEYKNYIFTGDSCLRICFDGPRLSEDLDFDLLPDDYEKFNIAKMAADCVNIFKNKYVLPVEAKIQGDYRIYLKFSVLRQLGLAVEKAQSDFLFLKLELNKAGFPKEAAEITPVAKFGYNFAVRNYKLEFLMTGKTNALFSRVWFKGKQNEVNIKGRDYFDFYWYLQKGVEPRWEILKKTIGISSRSELREKMLELIRQKATPQNLSYDLKNFFPDQNFITTFCENYEGLVMKYL